FCLFSGQRSGIARDQGGSSGIREVRVGTGDRGERRSLSGSPWESGRAQLSLGNPRGFDEPGRALSHEGPVKQASAMTLTPRGSRRGRYNQEAKCLGVAPASVPPGKGDRRAAESLLMMDPTDEPQDLLDRLRQGDQRALAELFSRHRDRLGRM